MVRRDSGKEGWELWKIIALFKTKNIRIQRTKRTEIKIQSQKTITCYYMIKMKGRRKNQIYCLVLKPGSL